MSEAKIRLHLEPLDEGGCVATSPDVPGLVAEGRSVAEAAELAQGLTRILVECWREDGHPLPSALTITLEARTLDLDVVVNLG